MNLHKPPFMEPPTQLGQALRAVKAFGDWTETMGLFSRRRSLSYLWMKDVSVSTGSHLHPEKVEPQM